MREIDDDYPTLDVFDAIHRELVTIIGHCTFHRSVLQDLILKQAEEQESPADAVRQWRDQSLSSVEQLRFAELNKQDKELSNAVFDEASRIAETFWNVLQSRTLSRERVEPGKTPVSAAPSDAAEGPQNNSPAQRKRAAS